MTPDVQINIAGKAGVIEAIYHIADKPPNKPFIVVCHPHPLHGGSMNNKVVHTLYKTFKQLSYPVLRFNFRGVGQTQGQFNGGVGESDDLRTVIDWLHQHLASGPVWLAGFSFGAYVALRTQNHEKVERLFLVAPPISLYHCENQPLQKPCTVIHGEQDELIPLQTVKKWTQNQPFSVFYSLEKACHFFHGNLIELSNLIRHNVGDERQLTA